MMFLTLKQMVTPKKKKCDTNKNVTKMGVIIKGVYYTKNGHDYKRDLL
jgi:hypothetical protein